MSASPPPGFGPSGPGQHPPGQPYQGPPPPGWQQPWYPPAGPPNKGNGTKWLIAGALVAVIVVAIAVIVVVLHSNSGGDSKGSTSSDSGVASANDQGPVAVITQDPSCGAWESTQNTLASTTNNGWAQRDPSIPASAWTPEQRAQYQAVGHALRGAADQTVALAKLTPHRVMRELYEQFIAYAREYADRVPNYSPADDHIAGAETSLVGALGGICDSIAFNAAAKRGPLVPASAPPSRTAPPADPSNPQRFLTSADSLCSDWNSAYVQLADDTETFRRQDFNVPADQWPSDQQVVNQTATSKMTAFADKADRLAQRSRNPQLADFAALSAQYYRAFVVAEPTYTSADSYLLGTASSAALTVRAACQAVGG